MPRLKTGDVVLLRGTRLASGLIACATRRWSHAAVVVVWDGAPCFLHATPNPAGIPDVLARRPFSGVTLTRARDEIDSGFYRRAAVFRTAEMRASAVMAVAREMWGMPYETNPVSLCCAVFKWCDVESADSVFCTELVGRALGMQFPSGLSPGDVERLPGMERVGALPLPPANVGAYLCNWRKAPDLDDETREASRPFGP